MQKNSEYSKCTLLRGGNNNMMKAIHEVKKADYETVVE